MCFAALITKWLWLVLQPSYKTPIHISPGSLDSGEGGNAILKLQLRHIPETEKLELFSNLSCFLQRNAHSCSDGKTA